MPANSSQQFDFVLSFDYFKTIKNWVTHWNASGPQNFVLLKKGTDISTFNKKVETIITTHTGDTTRKVLAVKFSDGYLYNYYENDTRAGERIKYVNLFTALAIFILLIACINFMNLSTAKAARRLKEVGIKKVVGAKRSQLIFQFLAESFLLTAVAMVIAIGLAAVLLPEFNQLTGKSIALHFTGRMIAAIAAIALITGFLAGSYPALYISGFNPLSILKGKLNTSAAELLSRKGLVVFQFTLSTILIVAVTIIYQQIQFIRNADIGYNKENIVRFTSEGNIQTSQETFLSEMRQIPGVVNGGYTFHNIIGRKYSDGLDWPGKGPGDKVYFEVFGVSPNFIETLGMQMKTGRSFSNDFGLDSLNIIINEAAAKAMNLKDPIGTIVRFYGANRQIIGVVKDFHFESMHEAIKPSFMHLQKGEGSIVARVKQENQRQTIGAIEALYKRYNPGFPFIFNFLDEAYQKQYETETRTATLSAYFAGLAIIISCLGLFGLTAFMAQRRKKEISIRKVIGAPVAGIIAMLSKDFLKLVCIALLIAFPISWWMMNSWLQSYTFRISITPTIFLVVGTFVFFITLIVIGFQTIKAAIANPIKSLRTE
jgi:putative ABC transport system permease protein